MTDPAPGDLLIATPTVADPEWRRSIILVLNHDDREGTIGLMVNRPATITGSGAPHWLEAADAVLYGGPVSANALTGLTGADHESPSGPQARLEVAGGLALLQLEHLPASNAEAMPGTMPVGPWRVFVGHCGWGAGQLAGERARGDWALVSGTSDDVLATSPDQIWRRVLARQPPPLRLWATLPHDVTNN